MPVETNKIYSLTEVVRETGIPLKTLNTLLEHYGALVPTLMDGDKRRFPPGAIQIISRLWREYKGGVKAGKEESSAWFTATLDIIQESSKKLAEVADDLREVQNKLRAHPPGKIAFINALPGSDLELTRPIGVLVSIHGARPRCRSWPRSQLGDGTYWDLSARRSRAQGRGVSSGSNFHEKSSRAPVSETLSARQRATNGSERAPFGAKSTRRERFRNAESTFRLALLESSGTSLANPGRHVDSG